MDNNNSSVRYFLLAKGERKGPYSKNELKQKKISSGDLVWREGLEDWKEANSIDELEEIISRKKPPPEPRLEKVKRFLSSKRVLLYSVFAWTMLHFIIAIFSYSDIMNTNEGNGYEVSRIWPFSGFEHKYTVTESHTRITEGNPLSGSAETETTYWEEERTRYGGFFYNYDWSEIILYCLPAWLLVLYTYRNFSKS